MSNKHKPPQQPPEQAPKPKGLGEYIVSKVEEHGEKKKKKKAEKEAAKAPGTADPIKINESREYTQGFMDEVSKALQIDKTASADDVADILLMIQKRLKHETDDVVRDNLSSALLKIASRRPDAMAVIQNKADGGDKAAKGVLNILIKTDEGATPATLKKFGAYKNKSNWLLSADESMGVIGIIEEGAHKANKTPLTETAKKLGLKLEKIPATYKTGVLIELQARGLATADDLEKLGVIVYDDIVNKLRKAGYDDFAMCLGKLMQKGVGESTIDDIMMKAVQGDDMEKIFIAAYGEKTAKNIMKKLKSAKSLDELIKIAKDLPAENLYNISAVKELIDADFKALALLEKGEFEFSNGVLGVVKKRGNEYGPIWKKLIDNVKKYGLKAVYAGGELLLVSPTYRFIKQLGKKGTPWGRLKAGGRLVGQALVYAGIIFGLYILSKHYKKLRKEDLKEKFNKDFPDFYKEFAKFDPEFQDELLEFYLTKEGIYAVGELLGHFPTDVPKPHDSKALLELLDPAKGWFFYPGKGEKALMELVEAVPYKKWDKMKKWGKEVMGLEEEKKISGIIDDKKTVWKNKGYLMTQGEFFIAMTCEVDLKLDEKTTKYYIEHPKVFATIWTDILKGEFPRSLVSDLKLVSAYLGSKPGAGVGIPWVPTEKPALAPKEPFVAGSIMDVFDQYATFNPDLKGHFKGLLKKYNEDEEVRNRLNSFVLTDSEAVYGNIVALAWDVASGKIKSVDDVSEDVVSGKTSKGKSYWYWVGDKALMAAAPNVSGNKKMLQFVIDYSPVKKGKVTGLQQWLLDNWFNLFKQVKDKSGKYKTVELDDNLVKYLMEKKNPPAKGNIYKWLDGKKDSFDEPMKGEPKLYFKKGGSKKPVEDLYKAKLTPRDILPRLPGLTAAESKKKEIKMTKNAKNIASDIYTDSLGYLIANDKYLKAVSTKGEIDSKKEKKVNELARDLIYLYTAYYYHALKNEPAEVENTLDILDQMGIALLDEDMKEADSALPKDERIYGDKKVGDLVIVDGFKLADFLMSHKDMKKLTKKSKKSK